MIGRDADARCLPNCTNPERDLASGCANVDPHTNAHPYTNDVPDTNAHTHKHADKHADKYARFPDASNARAPKSDGDAHNASAVGHRVPDGRFNDHDANRQPSHG